MPKARKAARPDVPRPAPPAPPPLRSMREVGLGDGYWAGFLTGMIACAALVAIVLTVTHG